MKSNIIHPAVQFLHQLHQSEASPGLKTYLASLETAKTLSLETFTAGIEAFTQIANLNFEKRKQFYGSSFAGLHYPTDLAELCNTFFSSEPISANRLSSISPWEWDSYSQDYLSHYLIYKGNTPSKALNKLLQGPTAIDCNQFCQLGIFFGLRYMLGDKDFDKLFGKSALYLTRSLYQFIIDPLQPNGNPLYPFFHEVESKTIKDTEVYVTHVANDPRYPLKHPGGPDCGHNCLVVRGTYMIFDSRLETASKLNRSKVEKLLQEAFNAAQDEHDEAQLNSYQKQLDQFNPCLEKTYAELIDLAKNYATLILSEHEWKPKVFTHHSLTLVFDFKAFYHWMKQMDAEASLVSFTNYTPLSDEKLKIPHSLFQKIPYENRHLMSFDHFEIKTPLQSQLNNAARKFCSDIMQKKSSYMIFTGEAGIGKTASLVSCLKELSSRGKNVLLITEVIVHAWATQATSMEEVLACRKKVKDLLTPDIDVVFLDDDNILGWAGEILLEEVYRWYVTYPDKGLFITSNEPVTFKSCYGAQLDGSYQFPPFPGYTSDQYQNFIILQNLHGQSLRAQPSADIAELTDEQKIIFLSQCDPQASIGIIVSRETYLREQHRFYGDIEFIPGIDQKIFSAISCSLKNTRTFGPEYEKLRLGQKNWLEKYHYRDSPFNGFAFAGSEKNAVGIKIRSFTTTPHSTIALELLIEKYIGFETIGCIKNLLSIINYAHDQGGKKVILINSAEYSHEELLRKIQNETPDRERARTLSRLNALLFSPDLMKRQNQPKKTDTRQNFEKPNTNLFYQSKSRKALWESDVFQILKFDIFDRLDIAKPEPVLQNYFIKNLAEHLLFQCRLWKKDTRVSVYPNLSLYYSLRYFVLLQEKQNSTPKSSLSKNKMTFSVALSNFRRRLKNLENRTNTIGLT